MTLDALARPSGTFVMVAMDQRESLRTMLAAHHDDADDACMRRFKLAVARELAPYASGFLIDRPYVDELSLPPTCGLIVAADALRQPPGGVVEDTDLDSGVVDTARDAGAAALKLLVIWRDDGERARRLETAERFVETAHAARLLSVLEGVVRAEDREASIVEAARELSSVGPDLYKVEVPLHGQGPADELERRCAEIDAALDVPWVVLSQGVDPDDFRRAVEAACRAGASGFLAGRALWTSALGADDPTELLRERSVPRLGELAGIVDRHGRPWRSERDGQASSRP
jgi:sulfofructosephosphate aldolase